MDVWKLLYHLSTQADSAATEICYGWISREYKIISFNTKHGLYTTHLCKDVLFKIQHPRHHQYDKVHQSRTMEY